MHKNSTGISQVAVYFPTIRVINHCITLENGVMSMDRAFLAGMSASVVVWTAILQIDGVKTILQTGRKIVKISNLASTINRGSKIAFSDLKSRF